MAKKKTPSVLDGRDMDIIKLLRENSRARNVTIAKKVGLSEAAVRFRVKRLMKEGVIRRFTVETALEEPMAIVLIKTEPSRTPTITKVLKGISNEVFELSGGYDVAVILRSENTYRLNELVDRVRGLPGVLDTNTMMKLAGEPGDEG